MLRRSTVLQRSQGHLRRRLAVLPALTLIAAFVFAGGAIAQDDELSGEFSILVFNGSNAEHMLASVAAFEELHPGVAGKVDTITNEDWRQNAAFILSADDAPDVAFVQVDARVYPTLVDNGILSPIDDVWEELGLKDAYPKATVDVYTAADGHNYAVNTDVVWAPVVYYNKDAFAQAGIEFDGGRVESMEQWHEIGDKLNEAGYVPLTLGGGASFPLNHLTDQLLQTALTPDRLSEYLTNWRVGSESDAKYTDPEFVEVLSTLKDWGDRGLLGQGTAATSYEQAEQLFLAGKAAMVQTGSWGASTYRAQEPPFEFGWLIEPGLGETGTSFLTYAGNAYSIPVTAGEPELAKEFLKFVMSIENQSEILPQFGLIPARVDVDPMALEGIDVALQEQMAAFAEYGVSTLWGDTVPPALGEAIDPMLQGILVGTETPEGAAEKLQTILEDLQAG
jgi:ABC-type glycerol-3-phosphate transport system substrate-binding protein